MDLATLIPWGIGFVVMVGIILALMARQHSTETFKASQANQTAERESYIRAQEQAGLINRTSERKHHQIGLVLHGVLIVLATAGLILYFLSQKTFGPLGEIKSAMSIVSILFFAIIIVLWVLESQWLPYFGPYSTDWRVGLFIRFFGAGMLMASINALATEASQYQTVYFGDLTEFLLKGVVIIAYVCMLGLLFQVLYLPAMIKQHKKSIEPLLTGTQDSTTSS